MKHYTFWSVWFIPSNHILDLQKDMSLTNIMYENSCVQVDAAIRYLSFLVDVLTYRQAIQTLC